MVKRYIFILFVISICIISAKEKSNVLREIRETYYAGVEDKHYIDSLLVLIKDNYGEDTSAYPPMVLSYYAGAEALRAKHSFWPMSKLNHLSASMDIFKKIIRQEPANLEVRFMRYSILYYVPGILGYGPEKTNDFNTIMELLHKKQAFNLDKDIIKGIAEFMVRTEELDEKDIIFLKCKYNISLLDE